MAYYHAAWLHRLCLRAAAAAGSNVEVHVVTRVCTLQVAWLSWASAIAAFPPKVCRLGMYIMATFVAPAANSSCSTAIYGLPRCLMMLVPVPDISSVLQPLPSGQPPGTQTMHGL